jgi:hypothetical protein
LDKFIGQKEKLRFGFFKEDILILNGAIKYKQKWQ